MGILVRRFYGIESVYRVILDQKLKKRENFGIFIGGWKILFSVLLVSFVYNNKRGFFVHPSL